MKRLLLFVVLAVAALLAVLLVRTFTVESRQIAAGPPVPPPLLDRDAVIARFSRAIQFRTVSGEASARDAFVGWLAGRVQRRRGGRLRLGRGTLDDKLTVIALLEAAELLLAQNHRPRRTILFAFGPDEETGGAHGAAVVARLLASRLQRVHGVDERVGVDAYVRAIGFYRTLIVNMSS